MSDNVSKIEVEPITSRTLIPRRTEDSDDEIQATLHKIKSDFTGAYITIEFNEKEIKSGVLKNGYQKAFETMMEDCRHLAVENNMKIIKQPLLPNRS